MKDNPKPKLDLNFVYPSGRTRLEVMRSAAEKMRAALLARQAERKAGVNRVSPTTNLPQ